MNLCAQKVCLANELGGVSSRGMGVDFSGSGNLFQGAVAEKRDAIRERHGFFLIMGDEQEGDADFALQSFELGLHLFAKIRVQSGQRFVQEEKFRSIYERTSQCDALLLSAAEFCGARIGVVGHFHHNEGFADTRSNLVCRSFGYAKAIGYVVAHVEMREQSIVLKDCIYGTFVRGKRVQALAIHPDFTLTGLFEASDETKQGSFSGTAFAKKGQEFTGLNLQGKIFQHFTRGEAFGYSSDFKEDPTLCRG